MLTHIDVINMALNKLGIDAIESVTNMSTRAEIVSRVWENCRERLLCAFDWGFAKRKAKLAETTDKTPGWAHTYGYPADCLAIRRLSSEAIATMTIPDDSYQFEVMASASGQSKIVACNAANAYAEYTKKDIGVNVMSPEAVAALVWLVAAEASLPLNKSAAISANCLQGYYQSLSSAQFFDVWERSMSNGKWFSGQVDSARRG